MDVYGFLGVYYFWVCMGIYESLWMFMGISDNASVYECDGCRWMYMGVYGCLWVPINVYGFLGVYGYL